MWFLSLINRSLKIGLIFLVSWLQFCLPATSEIATVKEVITTGVGISRNAAIQDARRNAVEESAGIYILSETLVKNALMVKDKILSNSAGFISAYEVLSEKKVDGEIQVKIKAIVSLEPLVDQLGKLGLLKDWTVAVLVNGDQLPRKNTEAVRVVLNGAIVKSGFRVVQDSVLLSLAPPNFEQQIKEKNYLAITPLLKANGVDVLLVVDASVELSEPIETYTEMSYIALGELTIEAVQSSTAEIIAAQSFTNKGGGSQRQAANEALKKSAQQAAPYFIQQIARLPASVEKNIMLWVSHISYEQQLMLAKKLETLPQIKRSKIKTYINNQVQIQVQFDGSTEDLAKLLALHPQIKSLGLKITGLNQGQIHAKITN